MVDCNGAVLSIKYRDSNIVENYWFFFFFFLVDDRHTRRKCKCMRKYKLVVLPLIIEMTGFEIPVYSVET